MRARLLPLVLVPLLGLSACDKPQSPAPDQQTAAATRATRITVTQAALRPIEVTDSAVGWLEAKSAPFLTAEVDGRLTEITVDAGDRIEQGQLLARIDATPYRLAQQAAAADVARLKVLLDNAQRQLERQQKMLAEKFVTDSAVEQAEAELAALREQMRAAQAKLDNAERDLANTTVKAPVSGLIDQRLVAAGDFVGRGKPLFRLVSQELMQVRLPFPETLASKLKTGLPVRLSTPLSTQVVEGRIQELRPAVAQGSRAVEVIVELPNPEGWRPGASVRGQVVLATRQGVVVPEVAVVDRPAGRTVYTIDGNKAKAVLVKTGVMVDGGIEIVEGLAAGAVVAVDGAGFLTDGAAVTVPEKAQ